MTNNNRGVIGVGVNGAGGEIGGLLGRVFGCNMGAFPHLALTAFNAPGKELDQVVRWFEGFDGTIEPVTLPDDWRFALHNSRDPSQILWGDDVDLVIDATGAFKTREALEGHRRKPVMICCPPDDADDCDAVIVYGVNHHLLTGHETFFSAASCTTNAAALVLHALLHGSRHWMNFVDILTVHAVTPSQLKKGAAAAKEAMENIVPAKTGAAKALGKVLSPLAKNLHVECQRVPTRTASSLRFVIDYSHFCNWDAAQVNAIFATFAQAHPELMHFEPAPHNPKDKSQWRHSGHCVNRPFCVYVDGRLTQVQRGGKRVVVTAFYDNRAGFTWQALRVAQDWAYKRLALQGRAIAAK